MTEAVGSLREKLFNYIAICGGKVKIQSNVIIRLLHQSGLPQFLVLIEEECLALCALTLT